MNKLGTILTLTAWTIALTSHAQEFKLARNSGRLEIHLGRVTVEGTTGNEMIFTSGDHDRQKDERAEGLREINGSGLDDNTGLGINVSDKGGVVSVFQLKKMNSPTIKIMVPRGVIISYSHESQYGGEASFTNLQNEIEVAATYNSIELENCTGPLTVKTIYGHVEGVFDANSKGPISIVSVYGFVDVTLPAATKANVKLSTSYGEIYVAPEFKIEIDRQGDDMIRYSDRVNGKIGGGGMSIDLNCSYGKVYLRKKMKAPMLFLACLSAGTLTAQTKINKTLPFQNGQTIRMHFDYPELIRVKTWDKNEISIQGTASINQGESDDAFKLETSTSGNTISIRNEITGMNSLPRRVTAEVDGQKMVFRSEAEWRKYKEEHGNGSMNMSNGVDMEIILEIMVPHNAETTVESVYGMVEVRDFAGPLTVTATYGGVDATVTERTTGELVAETNYGHIYSNLNTKPGSGEVRDEDFHTQVSVKPGSGPRYSFESTYGNVYLRRSQ